MYVGSAGGADDVFDDSGTFGYLSAYAGTAGREAALTTREEFSPLGLEVYAVQ